MVGALVLPEVIDGKIDASATRRPRTLRVLMREGERESVCVCEREREMLHTCVRLGTESTVTQCLSPAHTQARVHDSKSVIGAAHLAAVSNNIFNEGAQVTHIHTHTNALTRRRTYIHTHTKHTNIHAHTHTHPPTHTHTSTQTGASSDSNILRLLLRACKPHSKTPPL
jgi:hypothetical protein